MQTSMQKIVIGFAGLGLVFGLMGCAAKEAPINPSDMARIEAAANKAEGAANKAEAAARSAAEAAQRADAAAQKAEAIFSKSMRK